MNKETRLLLCTALATGLISALWAWIAGQFMLKSWMGFLGSTSYFAISEKGFSGLRQSLIANVSGVSWAAGSMALVAVTGPSVMVVITGFISFAMCTQARFKLLGFIPGSFIGACAFFAAESSWLSVVLTLCLGGGAGYLMQISGQWLSEHWRKYICPE